MNIWNRIEAFNRQRNIPQNFNMWTEYENIKEELTELTEAKNEEETVDSLCDIVVFSVGAMWKLGYDPEKVMHETLLEIEDREQDQEQADLWKRFGAKGKWMKSSTQVDCYKADYENAKTR